MTSYQEAAQRGDPVGVVRQAVLFSALWAIGSSWSIAIREMVTSILPSDNVVGAELAAASVTTLLSLTVTCLVTARCCFTSSSEPSLEDRAERTQTTSRPPPRRR